MKDSTAGPDRGVWSPGTYTPSRRTALALYQIFGGLVVLSGEAVLAYKEKSSALLLHIFGTTAIILTILLVIHLVQVIWGTPRSLEISTDGVLLWRRHGTLEIFAWSEVESATRSRALGERLLFDIGGRTIALPSLGLTKEEWENVGKTVKICLAREGVTVQA